MKLPLDRFPLKSKLTEKELDDIIEYILTDARIIYDYKVKDFNTDKDTSNYLAIFKYFQQKIFIHL